MIRIYSAEICPFAQRTRALLERLDQGYELREIDLNDKPEEFTKISPTGKVPMLQDGEFILYESQVINDFLIEKYGWQEAYSTDLELKYRERLAMKQWDSVLLEPFYRSLSDPTAIEDARSEIEPELQQFNELVQDIAGETDNILAYHVSTFWVRMVWLDEFSEFPSVVEQFGDLYEWLNKAKDEEPIQETLPDKQRTVEVYRENYVNR